MRVLGIDPGYAIVGWGVVEYAGNRFAPVDFGAVCTDAGVPFERRLDEVYAGIKEVIERTRPEVLAIEKLFYQHNQTTVIGVAEARGVILLAAAQAGLPIYEYTPMQVKQAVTGYGKAVKKQVQEMTRVLLHLPGETVRCRRGIAQLEQQLQTEDFFRCHTAYLVNLAEIERIGAADLTLKDGTVLPVSKHRKKAFREAVAAFWGKDYA